VVVIATQQMVDIHLLGQEKEIRLLVIMEQLVVGIAIQL